MLILAHKTFLTLVNLNKINRHILFNSLRRGDCYDLEYMES